MKLIGAAKPSTAFLLVLPLLGNPSAAQIEPFRVQVSLITVGVRVTDRERHDVSGLLAHDFRILEDGAQQPLAFFSSEEQPLSLGILLDRSQSMGEADKLSRAKAAAEVLVHSGRPDNELFFIPFDHRIPRASSLLKDWERIAREIEATPAGGGTRLYDAIVETVEDLTRAKYRRQVLVVITDGADQHSQHTLDQVIHTLRQTQVQLYMIGYFTPEEDEVFRRGGPTLSLIDGTPVDNPRLVFERLADETGAEAFFPTTDEALRSIAEAISLDLRTQYTLAYYPPNPRLVGTYRRIRVEVKRKGLEVRTRPGYILSANVRPGSGASEAAPDRFIQHRPAAGGSEDGLTPDVQGTPRCEDFSDPASGWPTRADAFYSNRSYYLKGKDVLVTNRPRMNDFRASLRLEVRRAFRSTDKRISEGTMTGAGLVFRAGPGGLYAVIVYFNPNTSRGQCAAIRQVESVVEELGRWPVAVNLKRPVDLGVVAAGTDFEVLLSGRRVGTFQDGRFQSGVFGLVLSGSGEARFREFCVEPVACGNSSESPD